MANFFTPIQEAGKAVGKAFGKLGTGQKWAVGGAGAATLGGAALTGRAMGSGNTTINKNAFDEFANQAILEHMEKVAFGDFKPEDNAMYDAHKKYITALAALSQQEKQESRAFHQAYPGERAGLITSLLAGIPVGAAGGAFAGHKLFGSALGGGAIGAVLTPILAAAITEKINQMRNPDYKDAEEEYARRWAGPVMGWKEHNQIMRDAEAKYE